MSKRSPVLLVVGLLTSALPLLAADWPQFRGPDRSGVSTEKGLLQTWPAAGPPLTWTFKDAGAGYSSVAVVGDRVYTLGARGDTAFIIALDAAKGTQVWQTKLGPTFNFKGNSWGPGPRSTPTVDGPLLYALGGHGDLVCVEAAKGTEIWRKNLVKDFGGEMMSEWGFSESPLIDGDKLICTPGGSQGTLAALNKKTGAVIWRSKELTDKATYASLRVLEIGGIRHYVALTYIDNVKGSSVAGVAAADGRLLWYQPFQKGFVYAVAPTPVIQGNLVYVTAGYGAGSRLLKITPDGKDKLAVEELYSTREQKSVKNTHGGVVLVGDHVYGHSEKLGWVCQDLKTGKIAWKDNNSLECTSGSIVAADDRLYLYSDDGQAALLKVSPAGWEEAGKFTIPEVSKLRGEGTIGPQGGVWTNPVVANGKLYLRDQELLFCFDVRAGKAGK